MTLFVPPPYVEHVHRLALGVEPVDAMLGARISDSLQVHLDGIPFPKPPWGNTPSAHWFEYAPSLPHLRRRSSCLHALLDGPAVKSPVGVRIFDRQRHFVPRRLLIDLGSEKLAMVAPHLFPGAAYALSSTATALRGRVLLAGTTTPLRWARVVATVTGGSTVVGRAHGDDRGEFLLLLSSATLGIGAIVDPIQIDVHVYGPSPLPVPSAPSLPRMDPLWDLPVELVPPANVLTGEALSPDSTYVEMAISDGVSPPATPRVVDLVPAQTKTDEPPFFVQ